MGSVVTVVGAGLAGCEAAWQLAERGIGVRLVEQKPVARTPAQTTDAFCELVCSNSMRGAALSNAVGSLKEELRRAGSVVLSCADETRVPAGGALAVDRERFSALIEQRLRAHPRVEPSSRASSRRSPRRRQTRPSSWPRASLTGDALASDLARLVGAEHLAYYDAIAPIVSSDSIDWNKVFKQSRYGKGTDIGEASQEGSAPKGDDAYVNCPFDEAQYRAFVADVVAAKKVEPRGFEDVRYFEGCLPIEVMATRGEMTLAFGPMKPVGLVDPRTGARPFAVVQLRQEDAAATAYNLVGFQTRMTWPEQARVFRTIPGLEEAEIVRYGSVHRNTFIDAPRLLDARMQLRARANVFLAGQITGVEGYVESCGGRIRLRGHAGASASRERRRSASPDDHARRNPHPSGARRVGERRLSAFQRHVGLASAARRPPHEEAGPPGSDVRACAAGYRSLDRRCAARAPTATRPPGFVGRVDS